jgi:ribosomal protein S18 acetylase RimI-like enzyme
MAVTVRLMRPDEGRIFLQIHSRAIRGLAARHYPGSVIEAWALPATDENVKRLLSNPDGEIRLIAELDREPVGLGSLVVASSEVRSCYVMPKASRRGVGSALMLEMERLAMENGLVEVNLTSSTNAEPFYRALGYEVVDKVEHRLRSGPRMAAVTMRKRLLPTRIQPSPQ